MIDSPRQNKGDKGQSNSGSKTGKNTESQRKHVASKSHFSVTNVLRKTTGSLNSSYLAQKMSSHGSSTGIKQVQSKQQLAHTPSKFLTPRSSQGLLAETLDDFKAFFESFYITQEQNSLLSILDVKSYSSKHALNYLKLHKLLSSIYDTCSLRKDDADPTIYLHGLSYKARHPNRGTRKGSWCEDDLIGEQVPEEDYVDPSSKKIITKLLLEDKLRQEREERKKRKEVEKQKKYAAMNEDQKRAQMRLKLQKQVFGLRDFERQENGFRMQFKETLENVLSNNLPQSDVKEFTIISGSAVVQMTKNLLQDRQQRKTALFLQNGEVQITTNPIIQRIQNAKNHKAIKEKSLAQDAIVKSFHSTQVLIQSPKSPMSNTSKPGSAGQTDKRAMKVYNYSSLPAFIDDDVTGLSKQPKTHTERVMERIMQRRNLIKLDKPKEKPKNIVLQMLQSSFPELEQLFMDTAERRAHRRNIQLRMGGSFKSARSRVSLGGPHNQSTQNVLHRPLVKGNHQSSTSSFHALQQTAGPYQNLGFFGSDDENTLAGGTGWNSDDQFTATGDPVVPFDIGTQGTIDGEDSEISGPLIKVKPLFYRR